MSIKYEHNVLKINYNSLGAKEHPILSLVLFRIERYSRFLF